MSETNGSMTKSEFYKFCNIKHSNGTSYAKLADYYQDLYGKFITAEALRLRLYRFNKSGDQLSLGLDDESVDKDSGNQQKFNHIVDEIVDDEIENVKSTVKSKRDSSGNITAESILDKKFVNASDSDILKELGYSPLDWKLESIQFSNWHHHNKKEGTIELCSCKYKLKPINNNSATISEMVSAADEVFSRIPKSYRVVDSGGDSDDLSENLLVLNQIELHLGKLSEAIDTGVNYNTKIAIQRAHSIFDKAISIIDKEEVSNVLLVVGGDFFNSESNGKTYNGTEIQNDHRYKYLYQKGLEIYKYGIDLLRSTGCTINVLLCEGNHARSMEFFLYMALKSHYSNSDVAFSESFLDTQAIEFGNTSLFFNHGDTNISRLIDTIPAQFPGVYGNTSNRYLFVGHLHTHKVTTTDLAIQLRRVPAPCSIDNWHSQNRFGVGQIPSYEYVVISPTYGLVTSKFIYFEEDTELN